MRWVLWIYILIGSILSTLKLFCLVQDWNSEIEKHPVTFYITAVIGTILNVFIWPFNTSFSISKEDR